MRPQKYSYKVSPLHAAGIRVTSKRVRMREIAGRADQCVLKVSPDLSFQGGGVPGWVRPDSDGRGTTTSLTRTSPLWAPDHSSSTI